MGFTDENKEKNVARSLKRSVYFVPSTWSPVFRSSTLIRFHSFRVKHLCFGVVFQHRALSFHEKEVFYGHGPFVWNPDLLDILIQPIYWFVQYIISGMSLYLEATVLLLVLQKGFFSIAVFWISLLVWKCYEIYIRMSEMINISALCNNSLSYFRFSFPSIVQNFPSFFSFSFEYVSLLNIAKMKFFSFVWWKCLVWFGNLKKNHHIYVWRRGRMEAM